MRQILRTLRGYRSRTVTGLVLILWAGLATSASPGQPQEKRWTVPVVMEKATVRGKVVILETRKEDRKTVAGLPIEVWSTLEGQPDAKKMLLHATQTDEGGLFSLPLIDEGHYLLVVGYVQLNMTVVPLDERRRESNEPKILLILLPKDVV